MDLGDFIEFCEHLQGSEACFPFDDRVLVYKYNTKMYAFADTLNFSRINVKCEAEKAIELRERYPEITPGFHMNKKYWNTLSTQGNLSDSLIQQMIKDSYTLIVNSKKSRKKG
ncbi:MAG: MmcQ/YjbR family DNA-binding protein [Bacteroidales bacterium]